MSTGNPKAPAKAKLVFTSRLAPKRNAQEEQDLGIPISSELQARLPVVVAAGRTSPKPNLAARRAGAPRGAPARHFSTP